MVWTGTDAGLGKIPARHHIFRMTPNDKGAPAEPQPAEPAAKPKPPQDKPREIGGPKGPEPTRHGDWEYNGRCTDF
jgi:hypothetical protein